MTVLNSHLNNPLSYVLKTIIKKAIVTVVNICVVKYSSVKEQASHKASCMVDIWVTNSVVLFDDIEYTEHNPHGRLILM